MADAPVVDEPKYDPSEDIAPPVPEAPGAPAVPAEIKDETPSNTSVLDYAADAGKGLLRGAEGAVRGVRQVARGAAKALGSTDPALDSPLEYGSPDPETAAGHITAGITQAALGYGIGGIATAGLKLTGIAGAMAQSAVGTPLVADADQERLSNTLMQFPFLAPIVSHLAQDPMDNVLVSKVKAGLEDVLTTGAAGIAFKGFQLLYAKASGKVAPATIAKMESELVNESSLAKGVTSTVDPKTGKVIVPSTPIEPGTPLAAASAKMNGSSISPVPSTNGSVAAFKPEEFLPPSKAKEYISLRDMSSRDDVHRSAMQRLYTEAKSASLEKLNPVVNGQASKDATKQLLSDSLGGSSVPVGSAYRGGTKDELRAIFKSGKLQVGADAEGVPGISAATIESKGTTIYGDGNGYIVPPGAHKPSGRFGEVLADESLDPKQLKYVVEGKILSHDEAKAALLNGEAKALPKPSITVTAPDGSSGVKLTDAASVKFVNIMEKLQIRDAVQGTSNLRPGAMAKEGTLNAQYNTAPNNVLQSLKELGKLTKTQLEAVTPGYRSVDETKKLAGVMGQHPDELLANLKAANLGLDDIDAVATGARQYLQMKGSEMWATSRKALFSGDPESKALFEQQFAHLSEFQAQLSEVTTKLGRGLRSFGESVGPFDPAKLAAKLADPEQAATIQRLIAATDGDVDQIAHILKMQQMTWFQKAVGTHNEYWTGLGLLSRAATQVVNVGSTALNVLMEPAALVVGGTERGLTGQGWKEAREGIAFYSGLRSAFMDSMHMAWQAAKTERAILSQAGTMEQPTKYISALTYNMNPDSFMGKFVDLVGEGTRLSFRGLTAGDEFFKQISYRAKISASASREAVDMVKAGTLTKDGIPAYVEKALQESIDSAGAATNKAALKFAEKSTFTKDLSGSTWGDYASLGEIAARAASANPIIRGTLLPFVKTPTNVTRTTFEYTPLIGQLRKQFYTDVMEGGEKQALAVGRLTIGAGLYTGAMMLVMDGKITGAPPAPGVMMPKGWKPYSAVFKGMGEDGGDRYVSYQRLQPFGDILGLSADFGKLTGLVDENTRDGLAHSMSLALTKVLSGDIENPGMAGGLALSNSLISKTYLRSMTEFFSIMGGYNSDAKASRWFDQKVASYVPGAMAQFNSDDTIREVRGAMDAIMARLPGLSQTLPPQRDYFGKINDTKVGWPWSIIQPLAVSDTKTDVAINELQRLSQSSAQTRFEPPPHLQTIAGQKVDLKTVKNDAGVAAYDRMQELMQTVKPLGESQTFHEKIISIINSPRYQKGVESAVLDGSPLSGSGIRQNMIKAEEGKYRQAALDQTKNEYRAQLGIKSAMDDAITSKVARKKAGAGLYDKLLDMNK